MRVLARAFPPNNPSTSVTSTPTPGNSTSIWNFFLFGLPALAACRPDPYIDRRTGTASRVRIAMPRGLNVTHRELSLTGAVASDIWRPPALQAREDPLPTALCGPVHFLPLCWIHLA